MSTRYKIVTEWREFQRLVQPWNELASGSGADHSFMRHEWFDCWTRHFGNVDRIRVLTAWQDGLLMAAAPMQVVEKSMQGFRFRTLSFLSSGVSPRCTFLVHPEFGPEALFARLVETRAWHLTEMKNLEAGVGITDAYLSYLGRRRRRTAMIRPGRSSPYLLTDGDWSTYWNSLSKKLRQSVRTAKNRAESGPGYTIHRITTAEDLVRIMDDMAEVSRRSWKGGIGTDLASRPALRAFLLEFSRASQSWDGYEAWMIEMEGRMAAFDYYLKGPRAVSLIRTDFDEEFKFYSPGNILRVAMLEDLFGQEGTWEYDMGGQPYGYKMRWTSTVRDHVTVRAATRTLRGKAFMAADRLRRRGRKSLPEESN